MATTPRMPHPRHLTPAAWMVLAEIGVWVLIIAAAVHFL